MVFYRQLTPALFLSLLAWSCCVLDDPVLNVEWLYSDSLRFATLPQELRNNELLSALQGVHSRRTDENEFGKMIVHGWPVCEACFLGLYGISASTWRRRKNDVRHGKYTWEHGNAGREGTFTEQGYLSRAWMTTFFYSLGDFQPDTGEVHLPPMDQKDIHKEMVLELGEAAISLKYFYKVWATEYKEVRIPPEQRLGKCKTCADLHETIMDCKDSKEREGLKRTRVKHIRFVRSERLVYHQWRQTCKQKPDEYLMVILDGMDQSKTNIPFFNCGDQPLQMCARVVGAIAHGRQKQSYTYNVTHFTKETNTMAEVLARVLADQAPLPPNLIIQLDNTSTDNKNVKLFAFLGALVETEQVKSVTVNFLPVGHTHVSDNEPTVLENQTFRKINPPVDSCISMSSVCLCVGRHRPIVLTDIKGA